MLYLDVDSLDKQGGVQRKSTAAVDGEELLHFIQTFSEDRLQQKLLVDEISEKQIEMTSSTHDSFLPVCWKAPRPGPCEQRW